jgi:hypothetical protein
MKRRVTDLGNFKVVGTQGHIGTVQGILFDDTAWSLRYFVVMTRDKLGRRPILVAPKQIGSINDVNGAVRVALTSAQAAHHPDITSDMPVGLQKERETWTGMAFLPYWAAGGPVSNIILPACAAEIMNGQMVPEGQRNPHLRNSNEVLGYRLRASDGWSGRISDFVFDDADWLIQHVEVGVRQWPRITHVLLPPVVIIRINWRRQIFVTSLSRRAITSAPQAGTPPQVQQESDTNLLFHGAL